MPCSLCALFTRKRETRECSHALHARRLHLHRRLNLVVLLLRHEVIDGHVDLLRPHVLLFLRDSLHPHPCRHRCVVLLIRHRFVDVHILSLLRDSLPLPRLDSLQLLLPLLLQLVLVQGRVGGHHPVKAPRRHRSRRWGVRGGCGGGRGRGDGSGSGPCVHHGVLTRHAPLPSSIPHVSGHALLLRKLLLGHAHILRELDDVEARRRAQRGQRGDLHPRKGPRRCAHEDFVVDVVLVVRHDGVTGGHGPLPVHDVLEAEGARGKDARD
mmetsp:Transcript_21633/g.53456  ORF Transcript_21633/g.53456 Transcript_21633/m.53456 type:complete len:268 (-) Transcript_21633:1093-1896(-)